MTTDPPKKMMSLDEAIANGRNAPSSASDSQSPSSGSMSLDEAILKNRATDPSRRSFTQAPSAGGGVGQSSTPSTGQGALLGGQLPPSALDGGMLDDAGNGVMTAPPKLPISNTSFSLPTEAEESAIDQERGVISSARPIGQKFTAEDISAAGLGQERKEKEYSKRLKEGFGIEPRKDTPSYDTYREMTAYYDDQVADLDAGGLEEFRAQTEKSVQGLQGMAQELKGETEALEQYARDFEQQVLSLPPEEAQAAIENFNVQAKEQASNLAQKRKGIEDIEYALVRDIQMAALRDYDIKKETGSGFGVAALVGPKGIGKYTSGLASFIIDGVTSLMPKEFISPEVAAGTKTRDQAAKEMKRLMLDDIRSGASELTRKSLGIGTTEEYYQDAAANGPFMAKAMIGLGESAPAMASPYMTGIFFQIADAVGQELEGEEFDDIPEAEKTALKAAFGLPAMALERLGFRNLVKNSAATKAILARAIGKLPTNATPGQIQRIIDGETRNYVTNFTARMGGAVLAEGETGGAQTAVDITTREIYNALKGRDILDSPETLVDAAYQIAEGSALEMAGAGALGAPVAISAAIRTGKVTKDMTNKQYELLEGLLSDDGYPDVIAKYNDELVKSGKMTPEQKVKVEEDLRVATEVSLQIPEDLPTEKRREAFDLILEKQRLSRMDKNLTKGKIIAIDEKLAALAGVPESTPTPAHTPKESAPKKETPKGTPDPKPVEVEWSGEEVLAEDLKPDPEFEASSLRDNDIGRTVSYQGIEGVLAKNDDGYFIVTADQDIAIDGGLSDATNQELGLTARLSQPEVQIELTEVGVDDAAGIDPNAVLTDFGDGRIVYRGSEYGYVRTNLDGDGNEVSVTVMDASGKEKTIRNKQAVEEIVLQKLLYEDWINNQPTTNEITQAATELSLEERAPVPTKADKGRTRKVQPKRSDKTAQAPKEQVAAESPAAVAPQEVVVETQAVKTDDYLEPTTPAPPAGEAVTQPAKKEKAPTTPTPAATTEAVAEEGVREKTPIKDLPRPQFRDWRVSKTYHGSVTIVPNKVGGRFTDEQIDALGKWAKENGLTVNGRSPTKLNVHTRGSRSMNDFGVHGAAGVAAEAAAAKKAATKKAEADRDIEEREYLDKSPAWSWAKSVFGEDAMNTYNAIKLADFLDGKDKKFGGLVGRSWIDGLKKLGALPEDGQPVDFQKIKSAYTTAQKEVAAATDKAPEGEKKPTPKAPKKEAPKEEKPQEATKPQEAKPISDKAKAIADKLRQGKLGGKGLKSTIPGFEQAWDTAIEAAALTIEASGTAAQAIADAIRAFKATDWYKSATQAERQKREVEVSDYVADITSDKPKAPKSPKDKEDPKQVKKTFTTVRAYEGDFREGVKKELEKTGLYRVVEKQAEAKEAADAFIEKVGLEAALEAVDSGDVTGAARTFIRGAMLEDIDRRILQAEDQETIQALYVLQADLIQQMSAAHTSGGQEAAALNFLYQNTDLGFTSTKKAEEWEKEFGEKPSEEQMAKWRERDEEFKAIRKQLDEAIKRAEEAEGKATAEAIKQAVQRRKSRPKTHTQRANELADQFLKLKAAPMTFKDADGNIIKVMEMGGGWNELIDLGAKIIRKTGEIADGVNAILEKLREEGWFASLDDRNKAAIAQQIEDRFRAMNEEDLDGRIRIPKRMIREAVEAGANDINTLVAVIKEQLSEEYPDATDREIRDAITEYGKVVNMSQDEISAKIRRMRDIGRTISAIEDVENKIRPLRSGLQRDKLNAEQRALKKKLRELMKELPLDTETQQRELKTALDAAKTRTQNRIEDLQREIEMRERVRKNNKILTPDKELQDLITRKEELQKEHDAIFKDKAMTQEERLEAAVASARRSLEDVQRKIRERDLDPKKPAPITPNEKLLGLREQLEEARAEYNRLRDEEGIILRNRLATAKAMTKNRIADLQKRLDEKDFAPKKRKDPVEDTELTTLKAKQMRLRERYDKEFYKYRLTQRTPAERAKDAFWQGWSFARAINASFEVSFILIQGVAMTISNMWRKPATVDRAMKNMWRAFASETKSDVWMMRVKAQDWYPVAKKAKVAITEPHAELSAREESFFSDWTRMVWSMLGSPLLAVSVKAHVRWVAANPMRALERAASAYLDTLRVERFLDAIEVAKKNGKELSEKDLKDMADVINTLTGRGGLGKLEQNSDVLAKAFYSPRLWSASIKTATPYAFHYFGLIPFPVKNPQTGKFEIGTTSGISPTARKIALQDYGRFVGTTIGLVAMAALYLNNDDDDETGVELDPRSSDFLKIKVGDTRIDPWGGRIQQVVFTTKIVLGMLSIARDEPLLAHKNKRGELMPLGIDYKSPTTFDVGLQMAMNKLAPSASLLVEATRTKLRTDKSTGEQVRLNPYGEEFNLGNETLERLTPIYWQTVNEIAQEDPGAFEGFLLLYAFLGGGVQIQKPTEKWKPGRNSSSARPNIPKREIGRYPEPRSVGATEGSRGRYPTRNDE